MARTGKKQNARIRRWKQKIERHTTFHLESENQNRSKMRRDSVSCVRNQRSVRNAAQLLRLLKKVTIYIRSAWAERGKPQKRNSAEALKTA